MLKKVVFVGGTSFSGSTMLDMMLANDPQGFSCGEIVNLFHPTRPHHVNPWCGCGSYGCAVWRQIYEAGPRGFYTKISEVLPDVSFIVDSSKNTCWIKQQEKVARAHGLDVSHALIWKSPENLAKSYAKRGRLATFESAFINYHRLYTSRISSWAGVQYEQLVDNPSVLGDLCDRLGIPMYPSKHEFWGKCHHTLFGNNSAKVSLFQGEHPRFQIIKKQRVEFEGERATPVVQHRSIYRDSESSAVAGGETIDINWDRLNDIAVKLSCRSVGVFGYHCNDSDVAVNLSGANRVESALRCLSYSTRRLLTGLRYRQRFESAR